MSVIGNIFWLIFGGLIYSLLWLVVGVIWCVSIIGIPIGIQCFKIAGFVLCPFGKEIVYGGGGVSFIANVIWIVFFGWEFMLSALALGVVFCVTIVGIPFGIQFFKLAKLGLMPFGTDFV